MGGGYCQGRRRPQRRLRPSSWRPQGHGRQLQAISSRVSGLAGLETIFSRCEISTAEATTEGPRDSLGCCSHMPADMSHASSPCQSVNDGTTGHEARRACTFGRQLSRKDGCAGWTSIHRRRGLRCLRYEFQSGTQSPRLVARWPGFRTHESGSETSALRQGAVARHVHGSIPPLWRVDSRRLLDSSRKE